MYFFLGLLGSEKLILTDHMTLRMRNNPIVFVYCPQRIGGGGKNVI